MASPYDMFATEKKKEQEGVNLRYGDFRIKVARAGGSNHAFRKSLQAKLKPYKFQMDNDSMDEKVSESLLRETYAEHVILGWETEDNGNWRPEIQNANGDWIPYSVEACVQLLTDLPDLFRSIQGASGQMAMFKKEVEDRDVKN